MARRFLGYFFTTPSISSMSSGRYEESVGERITRHDGQTFKFFIRVAACELFTAIICNVAAAVIMAGKNSTKIFYRGSRSRVPRKQCSR